MRTGIFESYIQSQMIYDTIYQTAMEAPDSVDIREMTAQEYDDMEADVDPNGSNIDNSERLDTNIDDTLSSDNGTELETDESYEDEEMNSSEEDSLESEEDIPTEDEESIEGEDTSESTSDPRDYQKRLNIHKNMLRFLEIIEGNRESFDQRFSKVLTIDQSKDFHNILKAFNELIDITQEILCTKFINGDYQSLVKYYVSLNRVYDIIARMTANFVKQYYDENKN